MQRERRATALHRKTETGNVLRGTGRSHYWWRRSGPLKEAAADQMQHDVDDMRQVQKNTLRV